MVGINNLLDQEGSRQETNKEASGKIQVKHGNTSIAKQPLGTTGTGIGFVVARKQLDHLSTYLLDGWILVHGLG